MTACNVLRLTTFDAVEAFHAQWARELRCWPWLPYAAWAPDWWALAGRYDGIEIAPYRYSRRYPWHSTWSFASGCLWNASKASVTLLATLPASRGEPEDTRFASTADCAHGGVSDHA